MSQQRRGGQRGQIHRAWDLAKVCVIIPPKKPLPGLKTSFPQLGGAGRREQQLQGPRDGGKGGHTWPSATPPPACGRDRGWGGWDSSSLAGWSGAGAPDPGQPIPARAGPVPAASGARGSNHAASAARSGRQGAAKGSSGRGHPLAGPGAGVPRVASWPNASFNQFLETCVFANADRHPVSTAQ